MRTSPIVILRDWEPYPQLSGQLPHLGYRPYPTTYPHAMVEAKSVILTHGETELGLSKSKCTPCKTQEAGNVCLFSNRSLFSPSTDVSSSTAQNPKNKTKPENLHRDGRVSCGMTVAFYGKKLTMNNSHSTDGLPSEPEQNRTGMFFSFK